MNPRLFVTDILEVNPTTQQEELLDLFNSSNCISVRGGHGVGKSAVVAWLALYNLYNNYKSRTIILDNTGISFLEINKWNKLQDAFSLNKNKIYCKDYKYDWFCKEVKVDFDNAIETLSGYCGGNLLFIICEASSIPDEVFLLLECYINVDNNKIILLDVMLNNKGYFYNTHFKDNNSIWTKIHWDSRKSSLVSKYYISYMTEKYGEESNMFKVRVAGEPPL